MIFSPTPNIWCFFQEHVLSIGIYWPAICFREAGLRNSQKRQTIIVKWMEFFGLSIFCYATEWHMKSIFWGKTQVALCLRLAPSQWWRMGRTQRKPKNHTAKPRKATADACLGLESLNIWSSGRLGWFVRNTIFGEMSSRKSGDGHVNLTDHVTSSGSCQEPAMFYFVAWNWNPIELLRR